MSSEKNILAAVRDINTRFEEEKKFNWDDGRGPGDGSLQGPELGWPPTPALVAFYSITVSKCPNYI